VKKAKDKFPDIETALSNWVRNSQKDGIPLTDAAIKEKAQYFATAVSDNEFYSDSPSWLEKFKQKNGIRAGKLNGRASETNASDDGSLDPEPGDLESQNSPSPSEPKLESSSGFWKPSDQSQLLPRSSPDSPVLKPNPHQQPTELQMKANKQQKRANKPKTRTGYKVCK
jgi:hypothetical protein